MTFRPIHRFRTGLLLSAIAAAAGPPPTLAQDELLRGPDVSQRAADTLIVTDALGNLVPLEGRPEEAALERALIDPERAARLAREAIAARATAIGLMLVEHIDRVKEATDALTAEDRETARAIYADLYEQFDTGRMLHPLLTDFEEILAPEELAEVTRLVDEYWTARVDWELRDVDDPAPAARTRVARRLQFALFQRELGEAYRWSLRPFRNRLERIYEIAQPDDAQRAAIRAAIIDHIREAGLEATAKQRTRTAERIYSILTDEQRRRLFEHVLWSM